MHKIVVDMVDMVDMILTLTRAFVSSIIVSDYGILLRKITDRVM
jgi:hypothetical protein